MVRQTPWFERKFNFNFPAGLFPVIIERLRGTLPRIKHYISITEEPLWERRGDGWSAKEQLGHLYDLESLWYGRIEDFLSGEKTLRAADLTNTKTKEANHNLKSREELVSLFQSERTKLLSKVSDMNEETVSLISVHPRLEQPMRLIDAVFFVAEHDDHHLTKIAALLK
jgi:uncharacterized damage-inducible protein DinB